MKAFRVKSMMGKMVLTTKAYESEEAYWEDNPGSSMGLVYFQVIGYGKVRFGDVLIPVDDEE